MESEKSKVMLVRLLCVYVWKGGKKGLIVGPGIMGGWEYVSPGNSGSRDHGILEICGFWV